MKISKAEMARIILRNTPGIVSDRIFEMHGLSYYDVYKSRIARRYGGIGWEMKL